MKIRESIISRRKFLFGLILGGVGVLVSYGLIPVIKYLFFMTEAPLPKAVSMKKKALNGFPNNSARYFYYGWLPSIIIRTPQGEFRAFSAVCTHLDCIVSYRPQKRDIFCNCHDGIFDLNGKNIKGPPPKPLEPFDIVYNGEKVIIKKHEAPEKKKDNKKG
jgi:cytochrome b6-f complex iron-sulfur subunit